VSSDLSQISMLIKREIEARVLAPVIKALIQGWAVPMRS
jgi:hypothetical protein